MEIPKTMIAMVLERQGEKLKPMEMPVPTPGPEQILIKIEACGVCRTDLHIVDGELPDPKLPLILGHEIIGTVAGKGEKANGFYLGDRVGVPWLGYTDGTCRYCMKGKENLCINALFTGYTIDGGYAEYTVADHRYCFPIPKSYGDAEAAPLMCAGLIGYRSYRMAGPDAGRLGIYGFGAAAHIIAQVAVHQGRKVYAFTRAGDVEGQKFAKSLGAFWAGGSEEVPPEALDAAIIFAPVGSLIPAALKAIDKGGTVICGGIHMSDIQPFPYDLLWNEKVLRSVANLTREDGQEFLRIAPEVPVKTEVVTYPLEKANEALEDLRKGRFKGAAVLMVSESRSLQKDR